MIAFVVPLSLIELDVENVELVRSSDIPTGAKPADATAFGALAVTYQDLGGDYFLHRQSVHHQTQRLIRQLQRLGHIVTLEPAAQSA